VSVLQEGLRECLLPVTQESRSKLFLLVDNCGWFSGDIQHVTEGCGLGRVHVKIILLYLEEYKILILT
jgi:hypothetical protein